MVLDAKSIESGKLVCIKRIERISEEIEIARFLSSAENLLDTRNRCPPLLASFSDPTIPNVNYIVMPLLRPFDDPEFGALGEVVDFVTQVLEVR